MEPLIDISHEPDLGYVFYPPLKEAIFGGTRFDVIFHEQPTLRHYDPQSLRCTISRSERIETMLIHYATLPDHYRIIAGRIILVDRVNKHIEAFCFGGTLDILRHQQETICIFQSPVSILDLNTYHSSDMLMSNEVEILIAERRADWDPHHPHDFEMHMAQLDPELLYVSCLETLITKFADHPLLIDPVYREFLHLLQQEKATWQQNGRWPLLLPKLEDLL